MFCWQPINEIIFNRYCLEPEFSPLLASVLKKMFLNLGVNVKYRFVFTTKKDPVNSPNKKPATKLKTVKFIASPPGGFSKNFAHHPSLKIDSISKI